MKTDKLRQRYLEFFKEKGHKYIPSDSLVPGDPSVLFTPAGMNQFKPHFLGEKKDLSRATSCQKCLRTGDLENVGVTAFHHTFFEMLGNFSFGDYFKQEAIEWAWEFLMGELNMDPSDIWVSVYLDDEEAYAAWQKLGIPPERIVRLGAHSNFWPADAPALGPNGPCGPCSEIFFDKGKDVGCGQPGCNPDCDCDRFVEIWNLVFTQFNRVGPEQLERLGQKNIDTGMGLERMASVLQGKETNFGIDILAPVVDHVRKRLHAVMTDPGNKKFVHAIVDHARAAVFSICDGIFPSNEDRGYVVRRLIRKAAYHSLVLGCKKPFLYSLVPLYAELMRAPYPEVWDKKEDISAVIKAEEEKFLSTFESGRAQFDMIIQKARDEKAAVLKGEDIFKLYDTYGFPLETIKDLADDAGFAVEEEKFTGLLERQKELSRKQSMFDSEIFAREELDVAGKTEFSGYDGTEAEARVTGLFEGKEKAAALSPGKEGMIVLDKTPFYAESGGQREDRGEITGPSGIFSVEHVRKVKDVFVHSGRVVKGEIRPGDKVKACADRERRRGLMRAHTATHLMQAALREVLGTHVTQQGSLVEVDRLRFDFTHFKGLTAQELARVEEMVNLYILNADGVCTQVMAYNDAKKEKALAFFDDKYSDYVRVVGIGGYSKEFCGGTHVSNTMEIGSFCLLNEYSVSSGIRRIEAVTGREAYARFSGYKKLIGEAVALLKTKEEEIISRVEGLQKEIKKSAETIDMLGKKLMAAQAEELLSANTEKYKDVSLVVLPVRGQGFPQLLAQADIIREKISSGVVFLISEYQGSRIFVCTVTGDLEKKGFSCKQFVAENKDALGLKGGGRPHLVQGSIGSPADDIQYKGQVIEKIKECITKCVS